MAPGHGEINARARECSCITRAERRDHHSQRNPASASNEAFFGDVGGDQFGLRHDDDWQKLNGVWSWVDSRSRSESILILDGTPRYMILDQLAGELKIRWLDNLSNSEQTLQLRPGLTYFLLNKGQAFWNFFAQIEFDLPLNYGVKPVNERWTYLGALYHLTTSWSLGGFFAEHWQTWSSSSDYLAKGGSPYVISSQATSFSAMMIFEF